MKYTTNIHYNAMQEAHENKRREATRHNMGLVLLFALFVAQSLTLAYFMGCFK